MRKRLQKPVSGDYVNVETGEVIHVLLSMTRRQYREAFAMVFLDSIEYVAKSDLQGRVVKVWLYLISKMGYENEVRICITQAAKELGMKRENMSRAISELVKAGLLSRKERIGNSWIYVLNPRVAFRGRARSRDELIEKLEKRRKMKALAGGGSARPRSS